jgi:AGZA family xanthine/uracil permease-like MFS transporter
MNTIINYFELKTNKTSINQEIRAGITTFLTMAYIVIVNPAILSQTGMDANSVFMATCITSALGCILVGLLANYPVGIAPGMAMNAYFTYHIINNLGFAWQDAFGLIFISGVLFFLICITPVKTWIIDAIPHSLSLAISSGIGIFIGYIALKQIGLVTISHTGYPQMGNLINIPTLVALFSFISIIIMENYKIPGNIIIAIILATLLDHLSNYLLGTPTNLNSNLSSNLDINNLFSTFFSLSFSNINFNQYSFSIILTFLFVVLFDSTGTLIAVIRNKNHSKEISNQKTSNALLANSITTIIGSLAGTTPTSPYIESAAGIKAGGRTGLTAITIGICFLAALLLSPLIKLVPIYATAPALLYVSCLMIEHLADINWRVHTEAIPAALTLMMIPFTFSISDGIGFGIISYCLLKLFCKSEKPEESNNKVHPMMWVLGIMFILYFISRI